MKTKEIILKNYTLEYPVGENIQSYIEPTKEIAYHLMKNYTNKKQITFWCQGSSGAIIASLTAQYLPKSNIYHIKKQGEPSHSYGYNAPYNEINIIIDDFMSTGNTVINIYFESKSKIYILIVL